MVTDDVTGDEVNGNDTTTCNDNENVAVAETITMKTKSIMLI